jgi:hypothetical protein
MTGWDTLIPTAGMTVWCVADAKEFRFNGTVWAEDVAADQAARDAAAAANDALPGLQSAVSAAQSTANTANTAAAAAQTTANSKASTAVATTSANGLMSAADKTKLNGVAVGARAVARFTGAGVLNAAGSANIASVVRQSLGRYLVTFATPMPHNDYSIIGSVQTWPEALNGTNDALTMSAAQEVRNTRSVNSVVIATGLTNQNTLLDFPNVSVAFF